MRSVPWEGGRSTVEGVQYRGRCSVSWGDIMMQVGAGIMSTVEDIIFCYLSIVGDIMIHVEEYVSTVGMFSTVEVLKNKRFIP